MGGGSQTVTQESKQSVEPYVMAQQMSNVDVLNKLKGIPYSAYPWVPQMDYSKFGQGYFTGTYTNPLTGQTTTQTPTFQSMIAAQPQETTQGLSALVNRATAGSPILNAAQQNLSDTLSGKYLTAESNPYLSGMYDAASRQMMNQYMNATQPQTNAMFDRAGAFGGSAHRLYQAQQAQNLQQGLGDLASQLYGNQYEQERQKQLQAALVGPQIAQSDYYDIQALLSAGDIKRQDEQNKLNEMMNYYTQAQQYPFNMASTITNLFGPAMGGSAQSGGTWGTTESANPYYKTPASQMMGGLTTGAGLGTMLGMATGNPLIGALGGLGGLLTGLF